MLANIQFILNLKHFISRPSPKKDAKSSKTKNSSSTSFQDFQESISDAWDIGDDEFCIISGMTLGRSLHLFIELQLPSD